MLKKVMINMSSGSSKQPFYYLRPNKSIDRSLFIQTLIGLNNILPISEYSYLGFGSYLFDDFKLIHDTIGISKMISLEKESEEYTRAVFNKPYNCIEIINSTSSDYLSNLMVTDDSHGIFWLDYTAPAELGSQLADFATLLNIANANDIVRITLNANPDSLGKCKDPDKLQELRLDNLKDRVPDNYLFPSVTPNDVTKKKYPITLLKILKAVALESLIDSPPYSPAFFLPLFSCVYADGQQMVTLTGIVLDSHEKESRIKEALCKYSHVNYMWDNPCRIEIPHLTLREITEINKYLPDENVKQILTEKFPFVFSEKDEEMVDSYIEHYKFYPSYHKISF